MLLPETAGDVGVVVKPTFASVVGFTVTAELVSVVRFSVVSVAMRVHEVPVLIATPVAKVATPATAAMLSVPASVHVDVIVIVSVEEAPVVSTALVASSIDTEKLDNGAPAVVGDVGLAVKTTLVGVPAAEAAVAVASKTPVAIRAEHAPREMTLRSVELSDRPPLRVIDFSMAIPLPNERFNYGIG